MFGWILENPVEGERLSCCHDVVQSFQCTLAVVDVTAEAVKGLALALEGVHDIHGRDGLAAAVLY